MKEEGRKGLVTAVFFAIGFCVLLVHTRLLVEGSQVPTASFARAVIGGLITAKVLLAVDMLPFVDAFPHKPMIYNIGWKTSLYVVAALVYLYCEPFLKHLVGGSGLYASHFQAWHEVMRPRTWSIVIWLAVLLLMFVTMKEMARIIGKDQLKYMFLGRWTKPSGATRSRDAA